MGIRPDRSGSTCVYEWCVFFGGGKCCIGRVFFGKRLPCCIVHGVCHQISFILYSMDFLRAALVLTHYSAIDHCVVSAYSLIDRVVTVTATVTEFTKRYNTKPAIFHPSPR